MQMLNKKQMDPDQQLDAKPADLDLHCDFLSRSSYGRKRVKILIQILRIYYVLRGLQSI